MSIIDRLSHRWPKTVPVRIIPPVRWAQQRPTFRDAEPALIDAALARSQRRPSGNWYTFAASRDVRGDRPLGTRVAGAELVAWRDEAGTLVVGPAACPHLGADLATGRIDCGGLVCPWHGLKLNGGDRRQHGWRTLPSHDDGVLVWVRLDKVGGETPTDAPILPPRPAGAALDAVTRLEGRCTPADIIANRLDPWHGAWFHPYSFTSLEVISAPPRDASDDDDRLLVAVTFRMGRFGVPVIAEFTAPEPRTITMRIVDGEGTGSVVETHATPLGTGPDGHPRTAVIEAVVAHSDRDHFAHATLVAPLIRPLMRVAATKLWRDDLEYAERLYTMRTRRSPH